jgi:hypothetical protein
MRGLKVAREARRKISEVHPRVKIAIGVMLRQERHDLQSAAKQAGLTTNQLRDHLSRPSVISYLRQRRRAEVESACLSNIEALVKIRAEAAPTPAVHAIRTLEAIRSELIAEDGAAGASRLAAPGLVIVVAPHPVMVDQPQRLAGARTISEPGAIDHEVVDAEVSVDDDEPSSAPRAR